MSAAQEVVDAAEEIVAAMTDRLAGGAVEAQAMVDGFEEKVTRFLQAEHEDDLERVRDRSYRLGVQAVVDQIRGLLDQTECVPSRMSLYRRLAAIDSVDGVRRG